MIYAPIIENIVTAFIESQLSSVTIPFYSRNNNSQFTSAKLAIKDISTGDILTSLTSTNFDSDKTMVYFNLSSSSLVKSTKYQIQLALASNTETSAYSNVGIIKYIETPTVSLTCGEAQCIGSYSCSDPTEKVSEYKFIIDSKDYGWQLHNSNNDIETTNSTDIINISLPISAIAHNISYQIKTTNGYSIIITKQITISKTKNESLVLTAKQINDLPQIKISANISSQYDLYKISTTQKELIGTYESDFSYIDNNIASGIEYTYSLENSTEYSTVSIVCYYEDIYLYDNNKQLRVQFNPEISSYKLQNSITKQETLGNQYPFIFKNGNTLYKEFNINGLISYLEDLDNIFSNISTEYNTSTNLQNMKLEYDFREEVLQWLNNGKPKLFKSPQEGNMIVMLYNISLTPRQEVGRLIGTFTATATEIAECTEENIKNLL